MKEVFYELRAHKTYYLNTNTNVNSKLIFMIVKNKMGTLIYREGLGQKENWCPAIIFGGTLIDRDKSYEVLDAMRELL